MRGQHDLKFILLNLIEKDFAIRYRSMSLGVLWSLLNPVVSMCVVTFVFTVVFPNKASSSYPVFLLCGLVPFAFFNVGWANGTTSLTNNVGLIKRLPIPPVLIPISSVLSNALHFLIQVALLLGVTLSFGYPLTPQWLWLPLLLGCEVVFLSGVVLVSSAIDVYVRDTRYLVEIFSSVLFWLVPIVYTLELVPQEYRYVYEYNPIAALIVGLRRVLMEGGSPNGTSGLMYKLAVSSCGTCVFGLWIFNHSCPKQLCLTLETEKPSYNQA